MFLASEPIRVFVVDLTCLNFDGILALAFLQFKDIFKIVETFLL